MPDQTQTQAAEVDVDRDAILAEMASNARGAGAPTKTDPAPELESKAAEATTEPEEAEPEEAEGAADVEPERKVEAKPDPETDRRLASIQKAEKEAKQRAAAERAALAKERAEIEAARKQADETTKELATFRQALQRAKYDPAGLLEALGVPADRFEDVAAQIYARSEKGKTDPRYKAVSERAMLDREYADKMANLEKRLEETQRRIDEREARIEAERAAERHMTGVFKAARVSKEAPLLARLIAKDPEKADRKLAGIALELANETGELPDAEDVIITYEKRRRAELEDDGVDVDAMLKTPKPQSKTAGEKPSARTLSNDLSTSTQVRRSDLSEQEERDQILAEIAKLNRGSDADPRRG